MPSAAMRDREGRFDFWATTVASMGQGRSTHTRRINRLKRLLRTLLRESRGDLFAGVLLWIIAGILEKFVQDSDSGLSLLHLALIIAPVILVSRYLIHSVTRLQASGPTPLQPYLRPRVLTVVILSFISFLGHLEIGDGVIPPIKPNLPLTLLVAPFEGPEPSKYRVTEAMMATISASLRGYNDLRVQLLDKPITVRDGAEEARRILRERGAGAIVWGWYGVTEAKVSASVYIEFGEGIEPSVTLCNAIAGDLRLPSRVEIESGRLRVSDKVEIESMGFQINVGEEIASVALLFAGIGRFVSNDFQGAIERFSAIERLTSDQTVPFERTDILFYRALARHLLNERELALRDLNAALALNSSLQKALLLRGIVNFSLAKYAEAIVDLNQVVDPSEPWVPYMRGTAAAGIGQFEQALEDSEKLLALQPNNNKGYELRGWANIGLKNYEGAVRDFTTAIQNGLATPCNFFDRALAQKSLGRYAEARDDFETYVKAMPTSMSGLVALAQLDYDRGDDDAALQRANSILRRDPRNEPAYVLRAMIFHRMKRFSDAVSDYEQVVALSGNTKQVEWAKQNVKALKEYVSLTTP